jgi:hypothetical protein
MSGQLGRAAVTPADRPALMLPPDDLPDIRREIEQGRMVSGPSLNSLLQEFFEAVDRRLKDGQST